MAFQYNQILNIPDRCLLNKKLTKAFFLKNFELAVAEKKLLNNVVLGMEWLASIKPLVANIPTVKNDVYIYEEIQVMVCTVPSNQLAEVADKCITLMQKHIPYQMVVIVEDQDFFTINTCDKRINLNDGYKRTVEKYISTPPISKLYKTDVTEGFFKALDFATLDKTTLETTYKSYIHAVVQFQAASLTGAFNRRGRSRTEEDMELLATIELLEKEVVRLTNQIKKETQLNKKVSLNIEIQNRKKEIKSIQNKLNT